MVESVTKNMTPKAIRMSKVALSAALMAVLWAVVDTFANYEVDAVIVSSITALVMLVAQFYDHKARSKGAEVFEGDND